MYNDQSNPTLTNVTFSGNSAAYYGGAMLNGTSSPTLTNVTFSGNSVSAGSVYNKGGAIFNYADSDPQIRNTIFWGNTAPTGAQIYTSADGSAPVVVYSIVQGGYSGEGNLTTDPKLGTLGDNGGFTPTIPLLAGSSAVNNGNPAYCAGGSDQRGVNYVGPCDIGAYEYDGPAPTLYAKPAASGSNDCSSWANACTLQSALASS